MPEEKIVRRRRQPPVISDYNRLAAIIANWRRDHGFYTPNSISTEPVYGPPSEGQLTPISLADIMLAKMALVYSEIFEALEDFDNLRFDDEGVSVAKYHEELADVAIRILDICGTMSIDLSPSWLGEPKEHTSRREGLLEIGRETTAALEAVRRGLSNRFTAHLVNILLLLEYAADGKANLVKAINMKMKRNVRRPVRHGHKTNL